MHFDETCVGAIFTQLHAQAVLLPAVIAVNLLLDLLYRGRVLCLLHCLTDILVQGWGEGAFWRASIQGRAPLLSAVQLDQAAALRVAGEFTISAAQRLPQHLSSAQVTPARTAPQRQFHETVPLASLGQDAGILRLLEDAPHVAGSV